jgi:hypothetical protein
MLLYTPNPEILLYKLCTFFIIVIHGLSEQLEPLLEYPLLPKTVTCSIWQQSRNTFANTNTNARDCIGDTITQSMRVRIITWLYFTSKYFDTRYDHNRISRLLISEKILEEVDLFGTTWASKIVEESSKGDSIRDPAVSVRLPVSIPDCIGGTMSTL